MYGGDAYNPWPADPFPTNNMWNGGGYADMDALNQHPCISCEYCGGGHYFSTCPHNPNSNCFVGSNDRFHEDPTTYNSAWMSHTSWEGQCNNFSGFQQHGEPSSFDAYTYSPCNEQEQWQQPIEVQQQPLSLEEVLAANRASMDLHMAELDTLMGEPAHLVQQQPYEQQPSFLEESFRKFAENDAVLQSQAASIKNLEVQLEHLRNLMNQCPQETLPCMYEDTYEDEQECWTAATSGNEGQSSMQPILIEDLPVITGAAAVDHATAWPAACLPDCQMPADSPAFACTSTPNAPADSYATALPFVQATAWLVAPEPDVPEASQLAPSTSKVLADPQAIAWSFDQAPEWSAASIKSVTSLEIPVPPTQEKPLLMEFQEESVPAAHMKPMSGTLPNPDNKRGDVLVNTLAFPVDFMILDLEGSLEAQASSVSRLKLSKHLESCLPIPCKHSIVQLSQEHRSLKQHNDRTSFKVSSLKRRLIKKRAYSLLSPIN